MPRGNGGVIGPVNASVSGVWSLIEAQLRRSGNTWPNIYGSTLDETATGTDSIVGGLLYDRIIEELSTGSDSILSEIILAGGDPYFYLTTLLLSTTASDTQQNNTFLDSSTNNFTITRVPSAGPNAPTQGTFSPFSQTGWSNYFDGTDDRLSVPDDAKYYVGSSDFTIECLVYNTAWDVDDNLLFEKGRFAVGKEMRAYMDATSVVIALNVSGSATGAYTTITATTTNNLNTWYHLAFVRSGNTVYIFRDGTLLTSGSVTGTVFNSTEVMAIGGAADGNNNIMMNGYISNFRIITGQAVATSTFTPPTSPLTTSTTGWVVGGSAVALTGTVGLLTCQSNRFLDTSASPLSITVGAGTPTVVPFSPFNPTSAWSASTVGGSGYFDGTGDYLTANDNPALELGSSNFCLEFMYYPTSSANTDFVTKRVNTASYGLIIVQTGLALNFWLSSSGSSWDLFSNAALGSVTLNAWNHLAIYRIGNAWYSSLNGTITTLSASLSGSVVNNAANWNIGGNNYTAGSVIGYLSNFRLVIGSSVYTSTSAPIPTAPLTAVTNTQLLLNFTNSGIYDATAKSVLETVGSTQVSTAQSKWAPTSMLFNGTTDYLQVNTASDLYNLSSGNWTIEAWVYRTGSGLMSPISYLNGSGTTLNGWTIQVNISSTGTLYWASHNASTSASGSAISGANAIPSGVWTYIAVTCVGTTITLYVNGAIVGTGTRGTIGNDSSCRLRIGGMNFTQIRYWQGYIQDPRITKGYARPITTPTAAFPVKGTPPINVEYLIVAGGGGGGGFAGGGGAGGFSSGTLPVSTQTTYTITVGTGGAASTSSTSDGSNGGNSSVVGGFLTAFASPGVVSTGGGGGGNFNQVAASSGGSGGGGGRGLGGAGISGQGNNGGNWAGLAYTVGGGGGGANAVGGTGNNTNAGNGGAGKEWPTGSGTYYAGGGGGGTDNYNSGPATRGTGGIGGGGDGARVTGPLTSTAGTANTGGGGGAGIVGTVAASAGGSGVVIIRYADSYAAATSTTGSPTITVSGGYRVYKWTGNGSITF